MTPPGLTTIASAFGPKETADRLAAAITAKGLTLFARVDHAAGAEAVGMELRPTEVLLFGNAKGGTPLMQAQQTAGIDLPLKALIWQNKAGQTFLTYNDPSWIAERHGIAAPAVVAALTNALVALAKAATEA